MPQIPTFEYKIKTFSNVKTHVGFEGWLNDYGSMGWEIVETWNDENVGIIYTKVLFKRLRH